MIHDKFDVKFHNVKSFCECKKECLSIDKNKRRVLERTYLKYQHDILVCVPQLLFFYRNNVYAMISS